MRTRQLLLGAALFATCALAAGAQIPRLTTLYPAGGRAGATTEVEIRGASLTGAQRVLVTGRGVTGEIEPGAGKVDETNKPLWQAKCQLCHELRSPANRSMTPDQWAATVQRMVKANGAPIAPADADKITQYLVSAARAGQLTAKLTAAPDAPPGLYEVRLVTAAGVSTAAPFEVGTLPERFAINGSLERAQPVELPCAVNGTFTGNGERHFFRFAAKKGQRLVFNLQGFRLDVASQMYFYPDLRLYDAQGQQLAENHGYYELDPLIDWTCPADGSYVLEVRDLLGRGNPGSVYRLSMGPLAYDTALYPPAVKAGAPASLQVAGQNAAAAACTVPPQPAPGVVTVPSPLGPQSLYVSPYPVVTPGPAAASLPAVFAGRLDRNDTVDTFTLRGTGDYEFTIVAQALGSPAVPRVDLLATGGGRIAGGAGDSRFGAHLEAGKEYTLRATSGDGPAGPASVYVVEARPVGPELACVVRPDNVTVRPGIATAVEVILTRRDRIDGDVEVTAQGLPPGVSAAPCRIPPDRDRAWLLLSAAPGAAPAASPIEVVATGHGAGGAATTAAVPQELYRLNNEERYRDRDQCVVCVAGQPAFRVTPVGSQPVRVHPTMQEPFEVSVERLNGFKGNVVVYLTGLPSGWTCPPVNVPPDAARVSLIVRPDGNNQAPFLNRDAKLTPAPAVLQAYADEFVFAFGTYPVARDPRPDPEEAKRR